MTGKPYLTELLAGLDGVTAVVLTAKQAKELGEYVEQIERERDDASLATHRQAYCIQQCAAHIGPETAATIDGLPKAVKRIVAELAAAKSRASALEQALRLAGELLEYGGFDLSFIDAALSSAQSSREDGSHA